MTIMEDDVDAMGPAESDDLLTTREFAQAKQVGEHAIHRLRDWEPGETVWGYDIYVGADARSTMGKTFKRGDGGSRRPSEVTESFVERINERMRRQLVTVRTPAVGFVWAGTIVTLDDETPPTHDPEPPMKFAQLTDILVVARTTREE